MVYWREKGAVVYEAESYAIANTLVVLLVVVLAIVMALFAVLVHSKKQYQQLMIDEI